MTFEPKNVGFPCHCFFIYPFLKKPCQFLFVFAVWSHLDEQGHPQSSILSILIDVLWIKKQLASFSLLSMSCVYSGQDEKMTILSGSPPSGTQKLRFSILLKLSLESLHLCNNCSLQLEVASSVIFNPSIDHICVLPPHKRKETAC